MEAPKTTVPRFHLLQPADD